MYRYGKIKNNGLKYVIKQFKIAYINDIKQSVN